MNGPVFKMENDPRVLPGGASFANSASMSSRSSSSSEGT